MLRPPLPHRLPSGARWQAPCDWREPPPRQREALSAGLSLVEPAPWRAPMRDTKGSWSHPHHFYGDACLRLEVPALPFGEGCVGGLAALHVLAHDALAGDDVGEIGLVGADRLAVDVKRVARVHL